MKKIFIFISLIVILFLAFLDAKDLYAELNSVATSRTPSQIEIRPIINRQRGESDNVNFDKNQNTMHDKMRVKQNNSNHNFQNSIDKMNERLNIRDNRYPKP